MRNFAWASGIGFAVQLAILKALRGDIDEARLTSLRPAIPDDRPN